MSINLKWQSGYYGKAGRNLRSGSDTRNAAAQANALLPVTALADEPINYKASAPVSLLAPSMALDTRARH